MSNQPPHSPSDDDWIFDPSLAAMNRSLSREIREEAEEIESIVQESEIRSRHMADIARELRNRGDLALVATPHRDFNGYVVYAAGDFLTLQSQDLEVDIALDHISFLKTIPLERGRAGRPGTDGPGTLEMRMVERVSPYQRVEIGFALRSESLYGSIVGTGQDHIIVVDEQRSEWVVPYSAIAFVARGGPRRMR